MERAGPARVIRLLCPPGGLEGGLGAVLELDQEETQHLRVRRADPGDRVQLFDGAGTTAEATVLSAERVRLDSVVRVASPPALVLAVGAGDKERFGWLAEKAAELGVTELIPLETERSQDVAGRVRAQHLSRLRRRARQAVTQSGAAWAPGIRELVTLPELIRVAPPGARWLADAGGGEPGPLAGDLTVVIGPEGGLTTAERELLLGEGFTPVRLAAATLRFETAAVAAATVAALRRRESGHG